MFLNLFQVFKTFLNSIILVAEEDEARSFMKTIWQNRGGSVIVLEVTYTIPYFIEISKLRLATIG